MKRYLVLFATCLTCAGFAQSEPSNREVLERLDAIKTELAAKRAEPLRWAFANKREIESAISAWNRDQMEKFKKSEALPPETEQKVRAYEALLSQFLQTQFESRYGSSHLSARPVRVGVVPEPPKPIPSDPTLSNQVAAAKAPIADILERRDRQAAQLRSKFTVESLISEYAKGRFDLIVDSSEERYRSSVLYRANPEVLDLTDAVIKLFKEKAKP